MIFWLIGHILDLQKSVLDPSLLLSSMNIIFILLSTDENIDAIPEPFLNTKGAIEKRFECHERVFPPSNFKVM